jgi:flagellar biosynthesis/type III secretory pathway protein FliH
MDSPSSNDDEFALAARERSRLQNNAAKQGYLAAVEEARIDAAKAAYAEEFAEAFEAARQAARTDAARALRGSTTIPS